MSPISAGMGAAAGPRSVLALSLGTLRSPCVGRVTGWGGSRRRGRDGGARGLSGGCDRPATCPPAAGLLLIGEARRAVVGALRTAARGRACHLPPTAGPRPGGFVVALLLLIPPTPQGKERRKKAGCNWALEGSRLSEEV